MSEHFSLSSALMMAAQDASGSLMNADGVISGASGLLSKGMGEAILAVGSTNVAEQLLNMDLGKQKSFNFQSLATSIVEQLGMDALNSAFKINTSTKGPVSVSAMAETDVEEAVLQTAVDTVASKEIERQSINLEGTIANAIGTAAGTFIGQEASSSLQQKINQQAYNKAQSQNGQQQSQAQLMSKYGINSNNNSTQTSASAASGYGSGNTSATAKTDGSNATTTDLGTALAMADAEVLANTPISQLAPDPTLFPTGSTNSGISVPSYSEIERMDAAAQVGFTNELGVTNTSPNNMNILEDINYLYGSILGAAARFLIPEINAVPSIARLANKFSGMWSDNSVRTNVYNNIAENQAAIQSSNFQVLIAKETQFNAGYNPDTWNMVTLQKGTIVYGGLPGQTAYYTTKNTLLLSGNDQEAFFQSLQVSPNPIQGYRPLVGVYEITENVRVPYGIATANTEYGIGSGEQFFIQNYSNTLKLTNTIELGETYEYGLQSYRPRP